VLLTLEEKKVPYEVKLIDLGNKPEWSVRLSPSVPFPPHAVSHESRPNTDWQSTAQAVS
jgi:hypothetical protein